MLLNGSKKIRVTVCVIVIILITGLLIFKEQRACRFNQDKLPLLPELTHELLANKFEYYIKQDPTLNNKVEFRLIVNSGSLNDPQGKEGLAHFAEHMPFTDTNWQEKLAKHGIALDYGLNGSTNYQQTIYTLSTPTTDEAIITVLSYLNAIAKGMPTNDVAIEKERKVIIEEWRLRTKNVTERIRLQTYRQLYPGSPFEQHPVGNYGSINAITKSDVDGFYKHWYQPENMKLLVVGDINQEFIEQQIISLFTNFKSEAATKPSISKQNVKAIDKNQVAIIIDHEIKDTVVSLSVSMPRLSTSRLGDLKQSWIDNMIVTSLNNRFKLLKRRGEIDFILGAQVNNGIGYTKERVLELVAFNIKHQDYSMINRLKIEWQRLIQHGLHKEEIDNYLSNIYQIQWDPYLNKIQGPLFLPFIQEHIIDSSHAMSFEDWLCIRRDFTYEEASALLSAYLLKLEQLPLTVTLQLNTEYKSNFDKLEIIERLKSSNITSSIKKFDYSIESNTTNEILNFNLPTSNALRRENINFLNSEKITLDNGLTIVVQQNKLRNQQNNLKLYAVKEIGLNYLDKQNRLAVELAMQLKALSNSPLTQQIEDYTWIFREGVGDKYYYYNLLGNTNNIDEILKLTYLNFQPVTLKSEYLDQVKKEKLNTLNYRRLDPDVVFDDKFESLLTGRELITAEDIRSITIDDVNLAYQNTLKNPADYMFFIDGNFKKGDVKQKVINTFSALNPLKTLLASSQKSPYLSKSQVFTQETRNTNRALVRIAFNSEHFNHTDGMENKLIAWLAQLLKVRLFDTLRRESSAIYDLTVIGIQPNKYSNIRLDLQFECDPLRSHELIQIVNQELNKLREQSFTEEELALLKKNLLASIDIPKSDVNYMPNMAVNYFFHKYNEYDLKSPEQHIQQFTPQLAKKYINLWLSAERQLTGVLLPKGS